MQTNHDVWPELQGPDLPKGKLKWADDLRSDEEEYLKTLENKLARLKRLDRPVPRSPVQEIPAQSADFAESIASDSDREEEVLGDAPPISGEDGDDEPGLALLWDQPKEDVVETHSPQQSTRSTSIWNGQPLPNPQHSLLSRAVSTASRVQFSPRVRITSGVHVNTPARRASSASFGPPMSVPSSSSSSVSVSLRTASPRIWLYPNQVLGSSSSDLDSSDYFTINQPSSSRSSSRRPSLPYNAEEERTAAEAARARALFMYPNTTPRSPTSSSLANNLTSTSNTRSEQSRRKKIKTEDQVIWGSHWKWLNWRWWCWKVLMGWKGFIRWMYRADVEEWEESVAERRALV